MFYVVEARKKYAVCELLRVELFARLKSPVTSTHSLLAQVASLEVV
jgi:hypothetical protein